jgi:lipoprotein LprG
MSVRTHRLGAALVVALGVVGMITSLPTAETAAGADETDPVVGEWLPADPDTLIATAADAMAAVSSVRFELQRSGEPVHIDPAESLSLDSAVGRLQVPTSAEALLTVTVDGSLVTELGAVAVDDTIWLSNPITGEFEPLPTGYDLDPRDFFDPDGAWKPFLRSLEDATLVDSDGDRYHLRAVAPGDQLGAVTAGLVGGTAHEIDVWLHPTTANITRLVVEHDGTSWDLRLSEFDVPVEVEPPVEADR